jgi:hypothetical protein
VTISSQNRKAGPYVGNDVTTDFPFEFKVFAASDLYVVYADPEEDTEEVLELDTDYTVALNADQDANPGGTVTLLVALADGKTLTVTSSMEYLQPTELTNQGGFYPSVINNALDRLTIFVQQLAEKLGRTVSFPISDPVGLNTQLPGAEARKGTVLAFDDVTGEPIVGPNIANVGLVAANIAAINTVAPHVDEIDIVANNLDDVTNFSDVYYGPSATDPTTRRDGSALVIGDLYFNTATNRLRSYTGSIWVEGTAGGVTVQTFSGDGTETEFTLSAAPQAESNTQVFIGGVYQQKSQYAVVADVLTFSDAPPVGTDNIEVVVFSVLPLGSTTADLVSYGDETVEEALNRRPQSCITPMMFGALCNGTNDDTAAFQDMLDYIASGGVNQVLIPSNHIARVNNLSINSSIRFFGGGEIRRLDDCDVPAVGNLAVSPGVYVFDIVEPTAVVVFDNLTLDANQAAQTNDEPTGIFVRVGNVTTSDPDIRTVVHFRDVKYKNNCKLAIYTATGDNSDHRTIVVIDGKCSFINGRFNTVDYDSDFIRVTDRTDLWIEKGTFEINEVTGVGEYTFPAVRMTVQASTFGVDDGPRCWISNSYFKNLGRPSAAVDAIGVIDFYRQAKDVHITNCTFEDCNKSPVRGKTSAQRVTISENHMVNCLDDYAINITPASDSTPPNFGQYIIDGNIMETCAGMVSVVANTTFTDPSFDLHITNNVGKNISGLNFAIYARRVAGIVVDNNTINGSTTGGIQLRECSRQKISRAKIYDVAGTTSDHGIWIRSSYGDIEISSCDILTATGQGITATIDGSHSGRFSVNDCTTDGTQDYGIIANTGAFTTIRFASNDCTNIAGLDRAFYAPSTRSALLVIGNSTDAATPLVNSGGGVRSEVGNSWQMA